MINFENLSNHTSGPLLESKGMHTIFHKTGKKGKIFESFSKNIESLKIFWKGAGDCMGLSHTQLTDRKGPVFRWRCCLQFYY